MTDELPIIEGLRKGDDKAYKYVYDTYFPRMCDLASIMLQDMDLARSTASDVISSMYESRDTLSERTQLPTYLMAGVRNRCINHFKSFCGKRMRPFSRLGDKELGQTFTGEDACDPQQQLITEELQKQVEEAINGLPEGWRSAYVKSQLEDKTYREISDEDKIALNTVRYRILQAMKMMHEKLDEYIEEEKPTSKEK